MKFKVYLPGKQEYQLDDQQDVKGEGGQAKIFVKQKLAFKIYHDPIAMLPVGKIQELSLLKNPQIIKPEDICYNKQNQAIGYTMPYFDKAGAICQLFTENYRKNHQISQENIYQLVQQLRDLITEIHQQKILIIDLNEFNLLLDDKGKKVLIIDTDSFQTPHYPAIAIMDNIRDWNAKEYSETTDWFSFAIIAFQMMVWAHPYHWSGCKKFNHLPIPERMVAMMKSNTSAMGPDVKLPKICFPIQQLPKNYHDWLYAILQEGKRFPPPTSFNDIVQIITQATILNKIDYLGNNHLEIKNLSSQFAFEIVNHFCFNQHQFIITEKFLHSDQFIQDIDFNIFENIYNQINVIYENKTASPILAYLESSAGQLILIDLLKYHNELNKKNQINCNLFGVNFMEYDNRLYLQNNDTIVEIKLTSVGDNIIVAPIKVAQCSHQGTQLYPGVMIQNLLGSYHLNFFPSSGESYQLIIPELSKYRIIEAKFDSQVLMIIAVKNGKYDRLVFRLDKNFKNYDLRTVEDIIYIGLNFVTLDTGTCVCLNENEELEVFKNQKDSNVLKIIQDPILTSKMRLFKKPGQLLFGQNKQLFSMKMK